MTRPWRSLLEGDAATRALDVVRAIASDRRAPSPLWRVKHDVGSDNDSASVAGGHAGLALLHGYLNRCGHAGDQAASAHLDVADQFVSESSLGVDLVRGFTGVAWVHAHLERRGLVDPIDLDDIDEALVAVLSMPWEGSYDLTDGLVGLGIYGLERRPAPAGDHIVDRVVHHLESIATSTPAGHTWYTRPELVPLEPREARTEGHYNLGVAHGIPGIIAWLGAAASAGHDRARHLLELAVPWLLAQELPAASHAAFGYWIEAGGASPLPARLGWCYGDAGIVAALLLAAEAAHRDDWRAAALRVAHRGATRSFESSEVMDAMFCHGASGVAHVFNRLYQSTGEEWLANAARDWFARTLQFQQPGEGIAGFRCWGPLGDGATGWHADPGLMTGTAGLALTLLAAVSDVEPEWDRLFLVSATRAVDG